jgi:hypothetical protein
MSELLLHLGDDRAESSDQSLGVSSEPDRVQLQPMIVLNSGDQLPDTAATEIGLAIWRYRSELAPIALACLTALAAAGIHHPDRRSWVWFALATIAITTALAVPPPVWARRAFANGHCGSACARSSGSPSQSVLLPSVRVTHFGYCPRPDS